MTEILNAVTTATLENDSVKVSQPANEAEVVMSEAVPVMVQPSQSQVVVSEVASAQPVTKAQVKNVMQIVALSHLLGQGMKVGRLAGNRDFDSKVVKAKKASLKKNGLMIPAVVVNADEAIRQGLEVVDFATGNPVTSEEASKYIVLVDANHRYKAHLELQSEDEEYTGEFYFIYPLNSEVVIAKMLAVINVDTNGWRGKDFGKGAKMMCKESLPLLDAINELTTDGYSLNSASEWLTFKCEINAKVLAEAMNGNISEKLKNTTGIERGKKLLSTAQKAFDEKVLKTRNIPDWIISKYDKAVDEDKATIINTIVSFFESLTRAEVVTIEAAKGERGKTTKEQIIYSKLDELFEAYQSKEGEAEQVS